MNKSFLLPALGVSPAVSRFDKDLKGMGFVQTGAEEYTYKGTYYDVVVLVEGDYIGMLNSSTNTADMVHAKDELGMSHLMDTLCMNMD